MPKRDYRSTRNLIISKDYFQDKSLLDETAGSPKTLLSAFSRKLRTDLLAPRMNGASNSALPFARRHTAVAATRADMGWAKGLGV